MNPDLLSLICDPVTRDALEAGTGEGHHWEILVNPNTGQRFFVRDGMFDVVFHFGGINFFNDRAAAIREVIRVTKPATKFVIGDENEALARRYEKLPVTGGFNGNRAWTITAPADLLPPEMQEVRVKGLAGGDLYCLSFRKPE